MKIIDFKWCVMTWFVMSEVAVFPAHAISRIQWRLHTMPKHYCWCKIQQCVMCFGFWENRVLEISQTWYVAQISDSYLHIHALNAKKKYLNAYFCTTLFWVGFQAPPACLSNKSSTRVKMSVGQWWSDTDRGKSKHRGVGERGRTCFVT
jgi:hypothetical protein